MANQFDSDSSFSSVGDNKNQAFDAFKQAHLQSDLDNESSSLHHSLGRAPNQAAAGNHRHDDLYELLGTASQGNVPVGAMIMWPANQGHPTNYIEPTGQTLNFSDYPELFAAYGIQTATFTLPNTADRAPVGHSATKPVNSTGGSNVPVDLTTNTVVTPTSTLVAGPTGTGDISVLDSVTVDVTVTPDPLPIQNPYFGVKFLIRVV